MTTSRAADLQPSEHQVLLDAALFIIRARGTANLTVADVLARANLGTRAFYRHYRSKDHLIVTVFADAGRNEALRLRRLMSDHDDPVHAVVAWIDGRLDLAFNDTVESDLRHVSREAQSLYAADPELMAAAYEAMLDPLVEELRRGSRRRRFKDVDPVADARFIQAVTWSCVEQQWATSELDRSEVRTRTVRFCLRALGAAPGAIARAIAL